MLNAMMTRSVHFLFLALVFFNGPSCHQIPSTELLGRWEAVEIIGTDSIIGYGLEFDPDGRMHTWWIGSDGERGQSTEKYSIDGGILTTYREDAPLYESRIVFDDSYPHDGSLALVLGDTRYRLVRRDDPFDVEHHPNAAEIVRLPRSFEQLELADLLVEFDGWDAIDACRADGSPARDLDKDAFTQWLTANTPPETSRTRLAVAIFSKRVDDPVETLDELERLLREHGYDAIGFYRASSQSRWNGFDVIRERPERRGK